MGLFGFGKKKKKEQILQQLHNAKDLGELGQIMAENNLIQVPQDDNHNCFGQRLDVLTSDGELPFGWVYHNKDFIEAQKDKIRPAENAIYDATKTTEKLAAYEEYFRTVHSVGEYCKGIGSVHYEWFRYHILTAQWYTETVKNYHELKEQAPDLIKREQWFEALDAKILEKLPLADGVIQSEFVKQFDDNERDYVRHYLSCAEKDGKIIREKAGRSYKLFIK